MQEPEIAQQERPWVFGLLVAPVAVLANGVTGAALAFLLRQQGTSPARSASIISFITLVQTIYFLWSPITDFWVRRRTWLVIGSFGGAIGILLAFHQASLASRTSVALMFLAACCTQLVVASCGGMMGELKSEEHRRQAGSFYQGGSLAFGALAVFALTMLAQRFSLDTLGWMTAGMIFLPSLAAFLAPGQVGVQSGDASATLQKIGSEFKTTFLHWGALPYVLLMTFPMASGAAMGLLTGIAQDYGVSGNQVAWMNGVGGALLTAAGAMAVTIIPGRVRASVAYLSVAMLNAVTLMILWLGPLRPPAYFSGTTLYLFTVGSCYALFTAVVLEFLGDSGKSGSGRYSIINSMGNIPVAYMTWIDGRGYARWGIRGLSATEAVLSVVGAGVLLTYFLSRKISSKT